MLSKRAVGLGLAYPSRMRLHTPVLVPAALLLACAPEAVPPPKEAQLRIAPLEVDFGEVLIGNTATRKVSLVNDGEAPYDPEVPPALGGADAAAFSVDTPCALPLQPAAFCELDLSYSPVEPGPHAATLTFEDGGAVALSGTVRGVLFSVDEVDFGAVLPGEVGRQSVTLTNVGAAGIELPLFVSGEGFSLRPGAPPSLAAGAAATVEVLFETENAGDVTGSLSVELCDTADCQNPSLPLRAHGAQPVITVTPATVAFGPVALGATADATLHVENAGDAPLVVEGLTLTDSSGNLALANAPALPVTIAPASALDVIVRNAPIQGTRALDASVIIASSDVVSPVVTVPVTGSTSGPGVVLTPSPVELGVVDEGVAHDVEVTLTSSGDAPASVVSVTFANGTGPFSVHGLPTLPITLDPDTAITFSVRALPQDEHLDGAIDNLVISVQDAANRLVPVTLTGGASGCNPRAVGFANVGRLSPGHADSGTVGIRNNGTSTCILVDAVFESPPQGEITFDPSGVAIILPGETRELVFTASPSAPGTISASVAVSFSHVAAPVVVEALAIGVEETLTGAPAALDLGTLPELCVFGTANMQIVNDGIEPATIESVSLVPPDAPFVVIAALPAFVPPGGRFPIEVGRLAAPIGHYTATLRARSNIANTVFIPLSLDVAQSGTPATEVFARSNFAPIDILFVVDNSGSMADNQARLVENFQRFVDQPAIANDEVDFHIGVTTTDTDAEAGRLVGFPAVLTNDTPDLATVFTANATVGTSGSASEAGLEASRLALSEPNLSGANAGFLRDEAALVIIYVSDEEDQSPLTVAQYEAFFASVKPSGVSVSAVADAGTRYESITSFYGGLRLSITAPDWGDQLGRLGAEVFASTPPVQLFYRLSAAIADPADVQVTVDGVPAAIASVDAPRRVIRLANAVPDGAVVAVTYVPLCQ